MGPPSRITPRWPRLEMLLGGGDLGVMRLVGPIAVVVLRQGLLPSISGGRAVDVHDRDNVNLALLPQTSGPRIVARKPLRRAAADPATARFPSVLASLQPDRQPPL